MTNSPIIPRGRGKKHERRKLLIYKHINRGVYEPVNIMDYLCNRDNKIACGAARICWRSAVRASPAKYTKWQSFFKSDNPLIE